LADSRFSTREVFAWFVAAASLLVACGLWFSSGATSSAVSLAQARDALKRQASDLIEVAWAPGTSPFKEKVAGDVVWSNLGQNGFMRFVGMPVNDPTVEQYQLWIIDPERDKEPIDGGVFDITSTDECLVEINAKLRVNRPVAFAVTIEKPGGVVVSTQERLPLLASVK
jgi:predicted Rdx family selenoprotein